MGKVMVFGKDDELISFTDEDTVEFADDDVPVVFSEPIEPPPWQIAIVDDKSGIHGATKNILIKMVYRGRKIEIFDAYDTDGAKELFHNYPNIHLLLLDMVMENEQSGRDVARYIRKNLGNHLVRIYIRTGQPDVAPEEKMIEDEELDISGYMDKNNLDIRDFRSKIRTGLQNARNLQDIEANKKGIENILDIFPYLLDQITRESPQKIAQVFIPHVLRILGFNKSSLYLTDGFTASLEGKRGFIIVAATGNYEVVIGKPMEKVVPKNIKDLLMEAVEKKDNVSKDNHFVIYFATVTGSQYLLYFYSPRRLRDSDYNTIRLYIDKIGTAFELQKANMEREAFQQKFMDAQREVILRISSLIELKDSNTWDHVMKTSQGAKLFGELVGMDPNRLKTFELVAPSHDVGKIGVPDNILLKPGKLDDDEWKKMRAHVHIGYKVFDGSDNEILRIAADVALNHHEWWDGSGGYPGKKRGKDLSMEVRIMAIIDVFDALVSRRPYKEPWPREAVIELFEDHKGTQFDPELTQIFLDNVDQFYKIVDQYSNGH